MRRRRATGRHSNPIKAYPPTLFHTFPHLPDWTLDPGYRNISFGQSTPNEGAGAGAGGETSSSSSAPIPSANSRVGTFPLSQSTSLVCMYGHPQHILCVVSAVLYFSKIDLLYISNIDIITSRERHHTYIQNPCLYVWSSST